MKRRMSKGAPDGLTTAAAESTKIFAIYALTLLMYTAASPDPDPNPRGGGQLPDPKSAILR